MINYAQSVCQSLCSAFIFFKKGCKSVSEKEGHTKEIFKIIINCLLITISIAFDLIYWCLCQHCLWSDLLMSLISHPNNFFVLFKILHFVFPEFTERIAVLVMHKVLYRYSVSILWIWFIIAFYVSIYMVHE